MSDNIIKFPSSDGNEDQDQDAAGQQASLSGIPGLSADQEKAIQVIMSGMSFACVGIKPTDQGADFFTAVEGDASDLRNALPHLEGVIERACDRKGL